MMTDPSSSLENAQAAVRKDTRNSTALRKVDVLTITPRAVENHTPAVEIRGTRSQIPAEEETLMNSRESVSSVKSEDITQTSARSAHKLRM